MKTMKLHVLFFFLCILQINAQENLNEHKTPLQLKFLAGATIEFGGDSVADIYFEDDTEQSVNAGQGASVFAGGELFFTESKNLSLRATVGFKYVTTKATNYNITLTRFPIDISANYRFAKKFRFAIGTVAHQNIKFNSDGLGENEKFSGSLGGRIEIAYKWIGLSYTAMNYTDSQNKMYNANAIGITLSSSNLF